MDDVADDSACVDARAAAAPPANPLAGLQVWLAEACASDVPAPSSVAFVTVGADGRPSARTVSLKRLDHDRLTFTSALWTRKAVELQSNPNVALLFHWPSLGRQVHITGRAAFTERDLARELFAERDLANQLQTLVSRQGTPIADLQPLRARHAHLKATMETPPDCPEDWGAICVTPDTVELWSEAPDRLHDRWLYERHDGGWKLTRIAP
ncbi:MAG TPA: pyridoxal 5'-phosphate synthase [Solirubrobacteraceae bacterium]|jgi:pyridoxamine 5'-phosphate oxidase|nr:pyridoxal 5'-phosphate synthase [Solirubrobacteraceae bacterium]